VSTDSNPRRTVRVAVYLQMAYTSTGHNAAVCGAEQRGSYLDGLDGEWLAQNAAVQYVYGTARDPPTGGARIMAHLPGVRACRQHLLADHRDKRGHDGTFQC